jgi:hypothetical protein
MSALQSIEYDIVRRDGARVRETIDLPKEVDVALGQLMRMHDAEKATPVAFCVNAERSKPFDRPIWLVLSARRTRGFLFRHPLLVYALALAFLALARCIGAAR